MGQTWRITRRKVAALRLLDAVGGIFHRPGNRSRLRAEEISRVLVVEPWQIGDVVMATPVLRLIRERFPDAHVTLLGKSHAEVLLRHSGLVDDVIVFDPPWTAKAGKYQPRRYDFRKLRAVVADLRSRKFDITIDARMDVRSNLLTFLTRAPRRVGYDFGGGTFLLTDTAPADPDNTHRVDDWLSLIMPLLEPRGEADRRDATDADSHYPMLAVSKEEREAAAAKLRDSGIGPDDIVVAFHGGASDPWRKWPAESFERVAAALVERRGAKCVFILEPEAAERSIPVASAVMRTSLREMMAILTCCDLFIGNDSGPMHIADALGVAVVAVFLTGNPVWHRPYRPEQSVVGRGTGHDFLVSPTEEAVLAAAEAQLDRLASQRLQSRTLAGGVT